MKNFNQLAKKKLLKIFLSSIKTKVAIKFLKKLFFFFFVENCLEAGLMGSQLDQISSPHLKTAQESNYFEC